MKTKIIIFLYLILMLGCAMESPITTYSFKIKNNTNSKLIIETKKVESGYSNIETKGMPTENTYFDTLQINEVFNKEFCEHYCFEDYKDSIVSTFFEKVKIHIGNKTCTIDPMKSSNWVPDLDQISSSGLFFAGKCKAGECSYSLIITEKDLKSSEIDYNNPVRRSVTQ